MKIFVLSSLSVIIFINFYRSMIYLKMICTRKPYVTSRFLSQNCVLIPAAVNLIYFMFIYPYFPEIFCIYITLLSSLIISYFNPLIGSGYIILGIEGNTFRESVKETLREVDISYEENMLGIVVTPYNTIARFSTYAGVIKRIDEKEKNYDKWRGDFIKKLQNYYNNNNIKMEITRPYYIILIITPILLVIALSFTWQ